MSRVSDPALLMQPEHAALCVRTHTTAEALPGFVGKSYRLLADYLAETDAMKTDLPYVAYHNEDTDDIDVEIGIPIDRELPGRDNLVCVRIPSRRVACCIHRGAYHRLGAVVGELRHFIEQQGGAPAEAVYETLLNGLNAPLEDQLTRVVIPVQD